MLIERHEFLFALLEDHPHFLGRQQVQILERVEIFRALCRSTGEARCARRFIRPVTRDDAPRRRRGKTFFQNGRWERTSRRSWLRFANAAVGGAGIASLSCRLVAWSARRAAPSIIVLAYSSQVSSGRARVYRAYLHRYTASS